MTITGTGHTAIVPFFIPSEGQRKVLNNNYCLLQWLPMIPVLIRVCVVAALNNSKSSKVPINSECDQSHDHKTSKYSNHSVC